MPVGGKPAKPETVITISRGGKAVAAISFAGVVGMCCTQLVPEPLPPISPEPPAPPPTATATEDATAESPPLPPCNYTEPRARSANRTPRIVGGSDADETAYPYAVSINDGSWHYCGGTVLNDTWILTAAHCQVQAGDIARVGASDRTKARQIRITESRINASYDSNRFKWDVAVARLASPAGVPPVQLATIVQEGEHATGVVIGWGRISEGGPTTNRLQEVTVPIVDRTLCRFVYGDIDTTQVCADGDGVGSCQGDSGGALLQLTPSGYAQIGVVSYGRGCARPDAPGVYTNVADAAVRDWIDRCSRD